MNLVNAILIRNSDMIPLRQSFTACLFLGCRYAASQQQCRTSGLPMMLVVPEVG